METKSKLRAISISLLIGTLVLLGAIWWTNGRDDTWLYVFSAIIVLSSLIPLLSGTNKDTLQK